MVGIATVLALALGEPAPTTPPRTGGEEFRIRRHPWDPYRHGFQWRLLVGASGCLPGKLKCSAEGGRTRASFGGSVDVGYLFEGMLFAGVGYDFGLFNPSYDDDAPRGAVRRTQSHGLFAMVKGYLPFLAFRPGIGVGPGWVRRWTLTKDGARVRSDGFAVRISPSFDFTFSTRLFIGASADFILDTARKVCTTGGAAGACPRNPGDTDLSPTHSVVFGLHLGGGFP